jgi:hypothetical protein
MTALITAWMRYNLVACPHRTTMDLRGDPAEQDKVSPFVQLRWIKALLMSRRRSATSGLPFLVLSDSAGHEKRRLTLEGMERDETLMHAHEIVRRIEWKLRCPILLRLAFSRS